MLFENLLKKADIEILSRSGSGDPDITGITFDSRKVKQGYAFVSIPGTKLDGDAFIADAITKGAVAIISEKMHPELNVPAVQVRNVRQCTGYLGAALWNIDVSDIKMIGITGTNGKTTTTHLFQKLLEQRYKKQDVWMFGTIDFHIGNRIIPATHTTPEAIEIFRCINDEGYSPEAIVMETSSHSLALDRISGLFYDVAVWTNLTQDHLDFHKTMDNYYQAKKRLFLDYMKPDGVAVVNIDDKWGKRLSSELDGRTILTYGRDSTADIQIDSWNCSWDGCEVTIVHNKKRVSFHSSLRGFFNVYNMTALIAGAYGLGYTDEIIQRAFSAVQTVAGRMDRVMINAPFAVIVDYAHTPDALENILTTARPLTKGRLICVFGCGGERDRTKRPVMGGIVAEHADEAIVTSDNPRSERPVAIIDEICAGIPLDFPHVTIPDRKAAIEVALRNANDGDCIVIAGKGHEDYQEINGVKYHFNDKETVEALYLQMGK